MHILTSILFFLIIYLNISDLVGVPVFYLVLPIYSFWKMDDFSWGTTRVTADDSNSKKAITADTMTMDEEQGGGGGGAVDSNKVSSTDTSDEGGNKASTDKVMATDADVDEEVGCRETDKSDEASIAKASGERASVAEDFNKVGSTGLGKEERMDSFLYDNLDSSTNQLNVVEKNPEGASKNIAPTPTWMGSILKGKVAVAFGSSSKS